MLKFLGRIKVWIILVFVKPRALIYYIRLIRNESCVLDDLKLFQAEALVNCFKRAQLKTRFYGKCLGGVDILSGNIYKNIQQLPVITKEMISVKAEDFFDNSMRRSQWKQGQTGGSTGTPFKYRISPRFNDMGFAILWRGWGRGGYRLGDRLAVLAGGSLVQKVKNNKTKALEFALNLRKYSSYGVDERMFRDYFEDMRAWQVDYLQGYVSSIYEYAKFLEKNNLKLKLKAIFTTSEMLLIGEREFIQKVFNCKVFNTYGLNDGGVSAFECSLGSMHIDMERAYLEVVDDDGRSLIDKVGRIVATSLINDATFFIRYDTGDLGRVSPDACKCGSPYPVLSELSGRKTDALHINNKMIGSPVLTVLMSGINVNRYQFIQDGISLTVVLDVDQRQYSKFDEEFIRKSLFSQVGKFDLVFKYGAENFEKTGNWKHRVVVKKS